MKALALKLAVIVVIVLIVVVDFASKVMSVAVDAIFAGVLIGLLWPVLFSSKRN